jgi:hypothetical protein
MQAAEQTLRTIEPGLRARLPVVRLTHSMNRCIIAYYLQTPVSPDGRRLLYFEFDRPEVDRREARPMQGWVTVADADGSSPRRLEKITVPSPSSGAQQQWCGELPRVAHFCVNDEGATTWQVIDTESGDRWHGQGEMRHVSPDGRRLSVQDPNPYRHGGTISHESVGARFLDYERSSAPMVAIFPLC